MIIRGKNPTRVVIDGRDFVGRDITINGDRVIVDGVTQPGSLVDLVNVTVYGDCEMAEVTRGHITVNGNAGSVKTASGDVDVAGSVTGNVETMSGDVQALSIHGSTRTMSGDIIRG